MTPHVMQSQTLNRIGSTESNAETQQVEKLCDQTEVAFSAEDRLQLILLFDTSYETYCVRERGKPVGRRTSS